MSPPPTSPVAVPVSAPARVRDLLRSAPDGPVPVLHRGPLALYVEVAGRCVGLLATGAAQVPCGLRSRLAELAPHAGRSAHVRSGVLHVDSRPLPVGRVVDVLVPRLERAGLRAAAVTSTATLPTPVVELVGSSTPDGLTPEAVDGLLGRGEGLTPLGDDVLSGWLATQRACGVPTPAVDAAVRAALGRTTLLSATLLECALAGEVLPELGAWLASVGTDDLPRRTADLLAVGGSSGAGLLAGALLALGAFPAVGASAA